MLVGNLGIVGWSWPHGLAASPLVDGLARLGVILLLFEVGLEATVSEMSRVGVRALVVAVLGVVAPWVLGWGVGAAAARLSPRLFGAAARLRGTGTALAAALVPCFGLAALASAVGLAPIVGAYAAGLVVEPAHYAPLTARGHRPLAELLQPVTALLAPVFFVVMGMRVDLQALAHPQILGLAALLTLAAIMGKQACALGALGAPLDGLTIGIGMIPRGEVGLIFANLGLSLRLHDRPILDATTYATLVLMVMATTLVTPPLLKWSFRRHRATAPRPRVESPLPPV